MSLTQETQREVASDDCRGNFEEQVSDTSDSAPADDEDNDDVVSMDAVNQPKEQDSGSPELEKDDVTETASPPGSVRAEEAMEVDLPQPEEIPFRRETNTGPPEGKGHSASDFDRSADFVRLTTPPDDQDDELEDGEIRDDDDELVSEERQESPSSETNEDVERSTGIVEVRGSQYSRNAEPVELEIEVDINIEVDAEEQEADEGAEEQGELAGKFRKGVLTIACVIGSITGSGANEEELANLSSSENEDGIQRGTAEVMGSRLEGVRADELTTLEEGEFTSLFLPTCSDSPFPSSK